MDSGRRVELATAGEQYDAAYFDSHLGEPYSWDSSSWRTFFGGVADFIVSSFRPASVLDAGCAIGLLVGALRERDVDARGIDISEYAISQVPDALRPFCTRASVTDELEGRFDLIVCIEVLEHVAAAEAAAAIASFAAHTDTVLFSSTPDDHDEPTHINVCSPESWVDTFAQHGFLPRPCSEAVALSPQAIVFDRRLPAPVPSELGAYEAVRYRLASELHLEGDRVRRLARDRDAALSEARRSAAAEAAARAEADNARAELAAVLASTWWRVGRPVRGAVTAARLFGLGRHGGPGNANPPRH